MTLPLLDGQVVQLLPDCCGVSIASTTESSGGQQLRALLVAGDLSMQLLSTPLTSSASGHVWQHDDCPQSLRFDHLASGWKLSEPTRWLAWSYDNQQPYDEGLPARYPAQSRLPRKLPDWISHLRGHDVHPRLKTALPICPTLVKSPRTQKKPMTEAAMTPRYSILWGCWKPLHELMPVTCTQ